MLYKVSIFSFTNLYPPFTLIWRLRLVNMLCSFLYTYIVMCVCVHLCRIVHVFHFNNSLTHSLSAHRKLTGSVMHRSKLSFTFLTFCLVFGMFVLDNGTARSHYCILSYHVRQFQVLFICLIPYSRAHHDTDNNVTISMIRDHHVENIFFSLFQVCLVINAVACTYTDCIFWKTCVLSHVTLCLTAAEAHEHTCSQQSSLVPSA